MSALLMSSSARTIWTDCRRSCRLVVRQVTVTRLASRASRETKTKPRRKRSFMTAFYDGRGLSCDSAAVSQPCSQNSKRGSNRVKWQRSFERYASNITSVMEREMTDQWIFKSETYDNCNCAVNCPCQFNLPSTHGYCQSAFVGNIVEGDFNGTPLAGLNWAALYKWPGETQTEKENARLLLTNARTKHSVSHLKQSSQERHANH